MSAQAKSAATSAASDLAEAAATLMRIASHAPPAAGVTAQFAGLADAAARLHGRAPSGDAAGDARAVLLALVASVDDLYMKLGERDTALAECRDEIAALRARLERAERWFGG
jgi:hypothetical protein